MNNQHIKILTQTVLPLAFFFSFVGYSFGFADPTTSPAAGNIAAPVNTGPLQQVKEGDLWANNLIAEQLRAANTLCIGQSNCRSNWPPNGTDFSTTCKINSKLVIDQQDSHGVPHEPTGDSNLDQLASRCVSRISPEERAAGWMFLGFDNCPGVSSRDCAGASYCHFIQLQCESGIEPAPGRVFWRN